jgi:hypothetical protein
MGPGSGERAVCDRVGRDLFGERDDDALVVRRLGREHDVPRPEVRDDLSGPWRFLGVPVLGTGGKSDDEGLRGGHIRQFAPDTALAVPGIADATANPM